MVTEAQVVQQVVEGLGGLLAIAVGSAITYVSKYVKAHYHSQVLNNVVEGLGVLTNSAVADLNQRVVADAKAQGMFTATLAKSVKDSAIQAVKDQGAGLIKLANGALGNVDTLIGNMVEHAVISNKLFTPTPLSVGIASEAPPQA